MLFFINRLYFHQWTNHDWTIKAPFCSLYIWRCVQIRTSFSYCSRRLSFSFLEWMLNWRSGSKRLTWSVFPSELSFGGTSAEDVKRKSSPQWKDTTNIWLRIHGDNLLRKTPRSIWITWLPQLLSMSICVPLINYFYKVLNLKDFTQRDHFPKKNDYYHCTLSAAKRTCKCEVEDCARDTSPPISRGLNHLRGPTGEKTKFDFFL